MCSHEFALHSGSWMIYTPSDSAERELLLATTNTVEITTSTSEAELARYANDGKAAGLVFCRGAEVRGKSVRNDYGMIRQAVAEGWRTGRPWRWALVLLDVMFVSGASRARRRDRGTAWA